MNELWTTMASLMGVLAFFQTLLHTVIPPELRFAVLKLLNRLFTCFSSYCYYEITEIDGVNTNELYNAVQLYLSSSAASAASTTSNRFSLTRGLNSSVITFGLANNDRLTDVFNQVTVVWEHIVTPRQSQTFSWRPMPEEKRGFTLRVNKRDKPRILEDYLNFITTRANIIRRLNQDRLLYTNSRGGSLDSRGHPWESVPFKHPSTFDTLAIDPTIKTGIMRDLKDFANGEEFYKRTGRAWKRGYLLYGPPGTGKSSMIAAMANYLGYDIYDLELTEVNTNSELRKLLMKTSSKSIIVIEDIDCSLNLTNRKKSNGNGGRNDNVSTTSSGPAGGTLPPVDPENNVNNNSITLSGLLNFTDGLWSCCGSERIFVFTTNHIEKLDPALLRSGRMDMHVFMSYCSFPSLKILLKNYLGCDDGDIEKDVLADIAAVIDAAEMTPADISEVLIKNRRDKEKAVRELLVALRSRAEKKRAADMRRRVVAEVEEAEEVAEEEEKRALDSPKDGGGAATGGSDDVEVNYKKEDNGIN